LSVAARVARELGLAQEASGYEQILAALGFAEPADVDVPDNYEDLLAAWKSSEPPSED